MVILIDAKACISDGSMLESADTFLFATIGNYYTYIVSRKHDGSYHLRSLQKIFNQVRHNDCQDQTV